MEDRKFHKTFVYLFTMVAVLAVVAAAGIWYRMGHAAGVSAGEEKARQELANRAVAYIAPKLHERVTNAMSRSADELHEVAERIEDRTWPDVIQREMETLARTYRRTVEQLRSHEINSSAQRFLDAALADSETAWSEINHAEAQSRSQFSREILEELDELERSSYYSLGLATNILRAALLLEEQDGD